MTNKKSYIFYWIFFALFLSLFFSIQIFSPELIKNLHQSEQLDLLNKISGVKDVQPVDFYLGDAEDKIFGPAKSVLAGVLLLSFALLFLKQASPFKFAIAVFFYLLISRYQILVYPPYGDALVGPFSDVIWLARNNFDYIQYFQLENFTTGGPQVYQTSLFPSFLALLIQITPSSKIFLITAHTIMFILASIIVATFRELLKKIFNEKSALLGSVLLLAFPLFQSTAELLNLEAPCLLFALLSVNQIAKRKIPSASLFAILSALMKPPGVIVCGTVFTAGILLMIIEPNRPSKIKDIFASIVSLAIGICIVLIRSHFIGEQPTYNQVGLFLGFKKILELPAFWLFLSSMLVTIITWLVRKQSSSIREFLNSRFVVLMIFVISSSWFLSYLNFSVMIHRYQFLLMPFFVFSLLYCASLLMKNRAVFQNLLILSIAFSFACSHGLIYNKEKFIEYGYPTFERSLEYRNDLLLHRTLADELQKKYSDYAIGAPIFFAQALNYKEVGYVDIPLDIVVYGNKATHEGMRDFEGLKKMDIRKTIWVGFNNKKRIIEQIPYPSGPKDKIVKNFTVGNKKAYFFQGGFAIEKFRIIWELYRRGLLEKINSQDKNFKEQLKKL